MSAAPRFSFEVRETDLMGRIGRLRVGGRSIETPYLFPVVHPVSRDIPLERFRALGFDGLMTNSFIIHQRRREEALEKGIHAMLGFDGMIMTDSGGYQVLEYGQLDITPRLIAEFQSSIGSNLAVTLDRPTGYSRSRGYAEETVEVSLRGAEETMEAYPRSETVWVGPVQGGLFSDLVRRSSRALVAGGFRMLALGSPTQIMENYLFPELLKMILDAKGSIPYSVPLHLFGAGHPLTLPLSVALGCDTFDSASYILFAKQGRYMTESGTLELADMGYLPCSCPVCVATTKAELMEMGRDERVSRVALHNVHLLRGELLRCKEAILEGRLWDLVEERATAHPSLARAFALLARRGETLRVGTAALKERGLFVRSRHDLRRPELLVAAEGLEGAFRRASRRAVLILSREGKPLNRMKVYRLLSRERGLRGRDVYRVHPQLGLYPAELEFVYPFTQTMDSRGMVPGRSALLLAKRKLSRLGYSAVTICDESSVTSTERLRRA